MKLDRNINENGKGKYALLNLRTEQLEWGKVGERDEFFVIKLKDIGAPRALEGYAKAYDEFDPEWSAEIREMAKRSGAHHKHGPRMAD